MTFLTTCVMLTCLTLPATVSDCGERVGAITEQQKDSKRRVTAPAIKQKPVDFNNPPREYASHSMRGWSVLVEKQLIDESPLVARAAMRRLEEKLGVLATKFPKANLPELRKIKIFLMYGPQAKGGGRASGLEYFSQAAAKHYKYIDPKMASSIVIFDASNYSRISDLWAIKALAHEFGHAHHLENWPEIQPDIYDTWERAMKAGLYSEIRKEDRRAHVANYAAQNHLEYFAELTAMYFVGGNYFPYDRPRLKKYDPAGHALIRQDVEHRLTKLVVVIEPARTDHSALSLSYRPRQSRAN